MENGLIYSCAGQHFKAYNSRYREVLEHPEEPQHVKLDFMLSEVSLTISVTNFIREPMRRENQKERVDIYILQDRFAEFLSIAERQLDQLTVRMADRRPWRYGKPIARDQRQGVPNLVKLAELPRVKTYVPFTRETVTVDGASMVVDSEIPGRFQTKWQREGGSRQIHLGVFNGKWNRSVNGNGDPRGEAVMLSVPATELKNNFFAAIRDNWVED